jgi:phosphate transport system protein
MFNSLWGDDVGLAKIFQDFGQMLEDGRHVFDAACNTLVGGTDPSVVESDLFSTDKRINKVERKIRRELVIHMSVRGGGAAIPVCLALMSLVKDAERIGDYAKNIFDVAKTCPEFRNDETAPDLTDVKNRVSRLLAKMRSLYETQNQEHARAFVEEADGILDHCDAKVTLLTSGDSTPAHPVAAALGYRYVKRVMAHAMNIVSSVFMPVHKLDYFDEPKKKGG